MHPEADKKKFRLPRKKILRKRTLITTLHTEGISFYAGCLRCIYFWASEPIEKKPHPPFQIGINVSKRLIKKAVLRNLLKRRIRESFRLQQHLLCSSVTLHTLYFFIHYQGKKVHTFQYISSAMERIIKELNQRQPEQISN